MKSWTLKELFLAITIFTLAFTSIYLTFNYLYIKKTVEKELKLESLNQAYKVSKKMIETSDLIVNYYNSYEKQMYSSLEIAQDYMKKHGRDASLEQLKNSLDKKNIDMLYNIYIIDENFTIQNTTFSPDLDLDFKKLPDQLENIQYAYENSQHTYISPTVNNAVSNNYKKYILQRAHNENYLIQLSIMIKDNVLSKNISKNNSNLLLADTYVIYPFKKNYESSELVWSLKPKNLKKSYTISSQEIFNQFVSKFDPDKKIKKENLKVSMIQFARDSPYKSRYFMRDNKYIHHIIMPFYSSLNAENASINFMSLEFDETQAKNSINKLESEILFVTFFILLVVTTALFIINKRIIKPIQQLQNDMKNKKKFNISSLSSPNDEIANMSSVYNQLLIDLQREITTNEELLEQFKIFASNAIHQVRTPVSVIKIALEMIEANNKEALLQIKSSLVTIDHIYDSLAFTLQENVINFPPKILSISQIIKERIAIFNTVALAHDINIESTISSNIQVNMNPTELEYLIDNNISNAIKYGDRNKSIHITLSLVEDEVIFSVKSSGKPIEQKEEIFKRYYRLDNNKRGNGIGLHIVKTICDRNNILINLDHRDKMNIFTYSIANSESNL